MLESFFQDIRVGLRVLVKEKNFCALAVTVLALGICAVTTQFAVVEGVMLRGFSFPRAEELVDVLLVDPTDFKPTNFNQRITTTDFVELKAQQKSFAGFVAYLNGSTVNLTYQGKPQRYTGGYITHDFFRVLGVAPALGRDFLPEDDRPGVAKAVILSDALWKKDFGGDARVLGQTVRVNGRAGTIIGVMPPRFTFPANEQVWLPVNTEFPPKARNDRTIQTVQIIGRLKPGVTMAQANAEMTALAKHFAETYPEDKAYSLGWVRPLIHSFVDGTTPGLLYTMFALCVGVLVIACVNVMNMQFARATIRAKELAIRSSLGATRTRLIRQMLTESLLLASLGALIGVGLSLWTIDWIDASLRALPNPPPSWIVFQLDAQVLTFVVGAAVLSAVLSGLLPAWMASRANAVEVLKESGRGHTGRFIGAVTRGLVIIQIVVTCIVLIASLLQAQSIVRQQHLDFGYDTGSLLSARLGLMEGDYPTNESRVVFHEKLLRELRANPEFAQSALTFRFQMLFAGNGRIELEGQKYADDKDRPDVNFENVSDGFFATTGQRLLDGRDFTPEDNDLREPVAVINASFAKKYFGKENPIGRRFRPAWNNGRFVDPWRKIVGVVSDVRMLAPFPSKRDNSGFYVPLNAFIYANGEPAINGLQFVTIVVRPRGGARPESLDLALRRTVAKVDPNLPLYFVATPRTNLGAQLGQLRVVSVLFTAFGVVAVVLASVGLYGLTSFAVSQRTQEFGIRMALGADQGLILRMVLGQAALQVALGLAAGLALTLLISVLGEKGLQSFLFQTSPRDPLTYAAVSVLLTLVALIATFFPARRATKVDPMTALRAE